MTVDARTPYEQYLANRIDALRVSATRARAYLTRMHRKCVFLGTGRDGRCSACRTLDDVLEREGA